MSTMPNFDVSRETRERMVELEVMVRHWNQTINLVSASTLSFFYDRHIVDALTMVEYNTVDGDWLDLGSGGGFPGLVIAMVLGTDRSVTLIESDVRKCAFLRAARRNLEIKCNIINSRIEDVEPARASVISARALAPLEPLISLAHQHSSSLSQFLFAKGENWVEEDKAARKCWSYNLNTVPVPNRADSVILHLTDVNRIVA